MFCRRPVKGVSSSISTVSFHERLTIRYSIPRVLIRVRRRTFTFRATARAMRLVSVDSLHVMSPAEKYHKVSQVRYSNRVAEAEEFAQINEQAIFINILALGSL